MGFVVSGVAELVPQCGQTLRSRHSFPSARRSSAAQGKRAFLSEHLARLKFWTLAAQLNSECQLRTGGVFPTENPHVRMAWI